MLNINSRKIGRFNISRPLMEDPQFEKMVLVIFSRIKVLRAQFNYQRELFEYEGICSDFDEIPVGLYIPEYELTFDAKSLKLSVKKIVSPDAVAMQEMVDILKKQLNDQQKQLADMRVQIGEMTIKMNKLVNAPMVQPVIEEKKQTGRKVKVKQIVPAVE